MFNTPRGLTRRNHPKEQSSYQIRKMENCGLILHVKNDVTSKAQEKNKSAEINLFSLYLLFIYIRSHGNSQLNLS